MGHMAIRTSRLCRPIHISPARGARTTRCLICYHFPETFINTNIAIRRVDDLENLGIQEVADLVIPFSTALPELKVINAMYN